MVDIEKNIKEIQKNVEKALKRANREGEEVTIIGVSKNVTEDKIIKAQTLGLKNFGENRVQEFKVKEESLKELDLNWHMIGHLQSNKVKDIIGKVTLLHSLDRMSLVKEIEKRGKRENLSLDALIQVNISGEESKFGLSREEVVPFIKKVLEYETINIKGLMTIAPHVEDEEIIQGTFRELRLLKEEIEDLNLPKVEMKYLSMGMTNDYEIAIEEGANIIRVGRAIFGERKY